MNTDVRILAATAIFATALIDVPAIAADETLPPELVACTKEREVIRRLSCFDSVMAELLATPEEIAPATAAAPAPPVPAKIPEQRRQAPAVVAAAASPAVAAVEVSQTPPAPDLAPESPAPTPTPEPAPTPTPEPAPVEVTAAEPANPPAAEPVNVPSAPPPAAPAAAVRQSSAVFEPEEFTATVRDIRKRPYGELVILLSNGQIWEQKHVDRRFRLDIGEEITISKGSVSGYRLSGRSNNSIQVERRK